MTDLKDVHLKMSFFVWTLSLLYPQYLCFFLVKIKKKGQFWKAEVMQILKLSLLFNFGQVEAEIFVLKQKWTFSR